MGSELGGFGAFGVDKVSEYVAPLQGAFFLGRIGIFPGRCPGLVCSSLTGTAWSVGMKKVEKNKKNARKTSGRA